MVTNIDTKKNYMRSHAKTGSLEWMNRKEQSVVVAEYVSGVVLLGKFISSHLILILPSLCTYDYAHFTNEETDTQIK